MLFDLEKGVRRGKDRKKGKERKGKEGKERKGKEGKERKGKEKEVKKKKRKGRKGIGKGMEGEGRGNLKVKS